MRRLLLFLLPLIASGCLVQTAPAANNTPTSVPKVVQATETPQPTMTPTATPTSAPTGTPTKPAPTPTVKDNFTPVPLGSAKEIDRGNAQRKEIALTFDAGAGATYTDAILKVLRTNTITSTLFLTGQWVETNPQLVRQIVTDGHEIGNHSYSHPDFTTISDAQIIDQLGKVEKDVQQLVGKTTKPFFRPPFGARNQHVLAVAAGQGYQAVYWTIDSGDWRDDYTSQMVLNTVVSKAVNGAIVVHHLDSKLTPSILQQEIDQLRAKGYSFVTVSRIMRP